MMVLQVNGIYKRLGGRPVLHDVSFGVDSGEILGFIGPNGAGKTTAIKVILGLLKPDSGTVSIFGHDVRTEHEAALESVGAIIESPELYSYMSGYDNLMQFARIYGIDEGRVFECARIVGLEKRLNDKVSRYSLGMRQRLGVAQAIMHKPGLLVLDEPTNGLDPDGIIDLRKTLKNVAAEGAAVLVSSHLLSELEHVCTSVCIIEKGVVISRRNFSAEETQIKKTQSLRVNDPALACSVLTAAGFVCSPDGESKATVSADTEEVPEVIKTLVEAQVAIYSVTEKKTTLEDAYITATSVASHGVTNPGEEEMI